ncbi:hypothetical protein CYLTODRAFT_344720 [Cylindrobasidium torrendii FP15055 ss-10]|uniref:Xylanolytic transcriptional activator regulatory domain-containing protein n=1 Tax=Cylindrobasidium torrendii FP15055 ss-10 TaxID=1314674 RepID=A0A0D7BNQ7_9AGAR|nr:hypothetical protein CYLTODRAFT_344720 [Cylindrobasidium torrendii FP15055 ss-10]
MFPAADLLDDLVKIFLRYFNQHFHILHGPTFVRQVAAGLHHTTPAFGSVVLAVCALASRYSDDPRVGEGHHKGWNYYTQIKAIHLGQYLDPANLLWDLQLFPLMGLYAYSLTLPDQCFLLTAMGIRLAQARSIHRLKPSDDKPWTANDELLKRTWWLLVVLDTYVSSFGGHRRVTDYEEFDAEYPLEVDDEFWPGEPLADPERPWHQPKRTNCRVSGWVYHLKLLSIYSFAQTTIYTIRRSPYWDCIGCPDWDRNIVVELDSALNAWLDSLPDFLRWDPHSPTADAAMLQSTLHFIQIQIHRPFLREFASNAICVTAARSCSHVLAAYSKGWPFLTMPMAFGWALYSSIILLLNVKDGKLASPRDLEDVAENMEMLSRHEGVWQVAGRYQYV